MSPPEPSRPGFARALLLATLCYAVASIAFTWPLAQHLDSWIVGGSRDGPMFLWNHWWGGHAAFDLGTHPLRTNFLFAPIGTSLALNTHALLPSLLLWPITVAFGVVVSINLSLLFATVLSGVGAWLLVNEVVGDRRAAFVAGFAFAFCHFRISGLMFHNLAQSHLLALFCWSAWAMFRRGSWRFGMLNGLFGAALLYSSYTLAVLAALWSLPFAVYALGSRIRTGPASIAGMALLLCLPAVLAAGFAAPVGVEIKREIDRHGNYTSLRRVQDLDNGSREEMRAWTEDEVSPLRRTLVRGPLEAGQGDSRVFTRRASYLGWSVLALAFFGMLRSYKRPAAWWWLVVAGFFLVASLGRELDLSGLVANEDPSSRQTLPYTWLRDLPLLKELRIPHRYGVVGALGLSVLAGFGWTAILGFVRRPRLALGLSAGVSALIFADFAQIPFPKTWAVPTPPPPLAAALEAIRNDPRDCFVLEFPAGRKGYSPFSYYDTLHQKPVYLDGQVARRLRKVEKAQRESVLRRELNTAFYSRTPDRVHYLRIQRKVQRLVRQERIGWIILAWDGQTRLESKYHSDGMPTIEERSKALLQLVREAFPVDPDFPPTLEVNGWGAPNSEFLRRPMKQIAAWEAASLPARKSTSCILLVAKLKWD